MCDNRRFALQGLVVGAVRPSRSGVSIVALTWAPSSRTASKASRDTHLKHKAGWLAPQLLED